MQDEPIAGSPRKKAPLQWQDFVERTCPAIGLAVFTACLPPLGATVLATSAVTTLGKDFLQASHDSSSELLGGILLGVAGFLVMLAYLLDMHLWWSRESSKGSAGRAAKCYVALCGGLLVGGLLCFSGRFPSLALMVGLACACLAAFAVRVCVFPTRSLASVCLSSAAAFTLHALLLTLLWVMVATTPLLLSDEYVSVSGVTVLQAFVLWASPLILAVMLVLAAGILYVRAHFHLSVENQLEDAELCHLRNEVLMLSTGIFVLMMGCWGAAMIAARGSGLSGLVTRISVLFCLGIAFQACAAVGSVRLLEASDEGILGQLPLILSSDWVKATVLLLAGPLVPLYVLLEVAHQATRRITVAAGLVDVEVEGIIPSNARENINQMLSWNRTSVFSKMLIVGWLYFVMNVLVSVGINLFFAWLIDMVQQSSVAQITLVLYLVGGAAFLLPPVPGLPVYISAGILLVGHGQQNGTGSSFWEDLSYACLVSFGIKIFGITLQQKLIGVPCSSSVQVKKMIGVHTMTMKAVRHVLSQPGLAFDKVCVLVAGPDWPTSVLTGVLDLPWLEMLMGSTPVIILIVPAVVAGGFLVRSAATEEQQELYNSISSVVLVATVVLQSLSLLLFLMRVWALVDEANMENCDWEADPQEEEVLAALKEDEEHQQRYDALTRWDRLPWWLRMVLVIGVLSIGVMLHIVLWPWFDPFMSFTVADHISRLPGGTAWGAINSQGWIAVGLACVGGVAYGMLQAWVTFTLGVVKLAETIPLTTSSFGAGATA